MPNEQVQHSAAMLCYAVIDGEMIEGEVVAVKKNGWRVIHDAVGGIHNDQSSTWAESKMRACELAAIRAMQRKFRRSHSFLEAAREIQRVMNLMDAIEA
jgi:DNA-directed RNA polymerase subunit E'/Rpb7